jgi:predicted small lipoprotein YifL
MMKKTYLALAGMVCLTACGVSGPLEKAPPLFGPDRIAYEAEQAKQEAERKAKEAARTTRNPAPAPTPTPAPKN